MAAKNDNPTHNMTELKFPHETIIEEKKVDSKKLPESIKNMLSDFQRLKNNLRHYLKKPKEYASKLELLKELSQDISDELSEFIEDHAEEEQQQQQPQQQQPQQQQPQQQQHNSSARGKSSSGWSTFFAFIGITLATITGVQIFKEVNKSEKK